MEARKNFAWPGIINLDVARNNKWLMLAEIKSILMVHILEEARKNLFRQISVYFLDCEIQMQVAIPIFYSSNTFCQSNNFWEHCSCVPYLFPYLFPMVLISYYFPIHLFIGDVDFTDSINVIVMENRDHSSIFLFRASTL